MSLRAAVDAARRRIKTEVPPRSRDPKVRDPSPNLIVIKRPGLGPRHVAGCVTNVTES